MSPGEMRAGSWAWNLSPGYRFSSNPHSALLEGTGMPSLRIFQLLSIPCFPFFSPSFFFQSRCLQQTRELRGSGAGLRASHRHRPQLQQSLRQDGVSSWNFGSPNTLEQGFYPCVPPRKKIPVVSGYFGWRKNSVFLSFKERSKVTAGFKKRPKKKNPLCDLDFDFLSPAWPCPA